MVSFKHLNSILRTLSKIPSYQSGYVLFTVPILLFPSPLKENLRQDFWIWPLSKENKVPRRWHSFGGKIQLLKNSSLLSCPRPGLCLSPSWHLCKEWLTLHTNVWRKIGSRLYKIIRKSSPPVLLNHPSCALSGSTLASLIYPKNINWASAMHRFCSRQWRSSYGNKIKQNKMTDLSLHSNVGVETNNKQD